MLLVCAGVAAFAFLGFWQLQRAQDKEMLLAGFAATDSRATVTLEQARRIAAGAVHPHVRVVGRFDPLRSWLHDDQVRDGRQGVMAWALFAPADGSLPLLVNRGFVARSHDAAALQVPPLAHGELELTGLYAAPPGSGLRLGGNRLPLQGDWPKTTIYIDPGEIGEDAGLRIDTRVLLLDAEPGSGFARDWTPQILPPERHRGYALQWFAFAVAALVIFIVLHWRRAKPGLK